MQGVSFETCMPQATCFAEGFLPTGYTTSCKQIFSVIRLLTETDQGSLAFDHFPIPTSCVCTYSNFS